MKAFFLVLVPFSILQAELLGKWQMVSFEAFSNITSSPRYFEASDDERKRFLIIDPALIIGEWKIVSYPAYEKLISSPMTRDMDPDDYLKGLDYYNHYMDSTYYKFTKDTLYFTDFKMGAIVPKIGKWHLDKDTLVVNDYEKIATYKYLVVKLDNEEFSLKGILKNGIVAKTPRTFKRANEN